MQNSSNFSMFLFLLAIAGSLIACPAAAEPRVQLELATQPDFPMARMHEWAAALSRMGLGSVRIREGRPTDRPQIKRVGSGDSASYTVTGILTRNNTLRLPDAEFRMTDAAGIKSWVAKLKQVGEAGLSEQPLAFGLTAEELVAVHEALSLTVPQKTLGKKTFDVLKTVANQLPIGFTADPAARRAMLEGGAVRDELDGLSAGTVMAAVLRPLGLVMVPHKESKELKLRITDVRNAPESWPVGWPPEKSPNETLPTLFNFLQVNIQDVPLPQAMTAISGRLNAPILYDHNSLARQRIDPATIRVSSPVGRQYFKRVLTHLLSPSRLTSELRVDEAGKPFLWISPLQR